MGKDTVIDNVTIGDETMLKAMCNCCSGCGKCKISQKVHMDWSKIIQIMFLFYWKEYVYYAFTQHVQLVNKEVYIQFRHLRNTVHRKRHKLHGKIVELNIVLSPTCHTSSFISNYLTKHETTIHSTLRTLCFPYAKVNSERTLFQTTKEIKENMA